MFNAVNQGRKYAPTRYAVTDDSLLTVRALHINKSPGTLSGAPERTWPPPGAKMRNSKGGVVVRVVRRNASPQPASLESLEAAWSERGHLEVKPLESLPIPERRNDKPEPAGVEGHGGGPPRSRKKGFRPPDVRTIFSPGERDPRVKEESGEGHCFVPKGENAWCDACCNYIFQHCITCAGCKYTCHAGCQDKVSLDCHSAASPLSQDQLNNNNTELHVSMRYVKHRGQTFKSRPVVVVCF
uniref:ras association domain-containing protein 5-like n=1 Tax=Monopterus albus TaxID=43700 RepID=UPI0009B33AC9|nr:ras association domain-containing protein 5-like [Monopterus albus]